MTNDNLLNEKEEFALQAMFGRAVPPVADEGFSATVSGRMHRRIWKRRVILWSAAAIGLIVSLPAASQLLFALGNELIALAGRAEQSDALGQFQVFLAMLPLHEAAQAAGEELRTISTQFNAISWFQQNQILLFAGLLAAVSFVTTRLIDD